MAAIEDFLADAKRRMDKSIEATHHEFNSIRTGRASPALLDRITIDYYGTPTPLKSLASISAPEPRLLVVQPFDPGAIKNIERAVQESDLGLTPSNDGKVVRLPIPALTEERRKDLVKVVRRVAEDGKVAIRNVRRDVMQHLKELVGERRRRRRRGAPWRAAGAEAHRRPCEVDRRPLEGERGRDHGGVTLADDAAAAARSVAIIMDGNGRWATARSLPVAEGHREGARALRRTVEAAVDLEIDSLAVYAFSTENWARPPHEVESILELLHETIERELPDLAKQGVRTRFFGRRDRVPADLQTKMAKLEAETAHLDRLQLWIAFDYGGRAELVEAMRSILREGVRHEDLSEADIAAHLYAPELPDPDLVIRTSGEQRISNFLLWQSAYAELVFDDTLWPDFGEERLRSALEEYASRARRFGAR